MTLVAAHLPHLPHLQYLNPGGDLAPVFSKRVCGVGGLERDLGWRWWWLVVSGSTGCARTKFAGGGGVWR
jgi:hypothetical protein